MTVLKNICREKSVLGVAQKSEKSNLPEYPRKVVARSARCSRGFAHAYGLQFDANPLRFRLVHADEGSQRPATRLVRSADRQDSEAGRQMVLHCGRG